jgi:hypothetical protein
VLRTATRRGERVIVLCHFPVLEAASTPALLLWNHEEILRILDQYRVVVAWFNGHDHRGGYAQRNGVHHVTSPGLVDSGKAASWTLVRALSDRSNFAAPEPLPAGFCRSRSGDGSLPMIALTGALSTLLILLAEVRAQRVPGGSPPAKAGR